MSEEDEVETSNFEEAEDAGTENGHLCTLFLADGWSAASISVAGLSVIGRKQYGMYRLLNLAHEAKHKSIANNPEINTLMEIVGLQFNVDYSTEEQRKTLRYGKLMILTDQNVEGSNFKGLFIYFIYTNWPYLLQLPFLEEFITPVVRVTRGETKRLFFSLPEFEEWKRDTLYIQAYTVKHYIGLGTNTWYEAKEYFSNIDLHRVTFKYDGPEDDQNLIKAFDKDTIEQRREWLTHHMNEWKRHSSYGLQSNAIMYTGKAKELTYSNFINLEYVFFANFDNACSIPSVVDGFTPGQRKVLFTCIKSDFKSKIKVAQLASFTAEVAAHYGYEMTICKIIMNMAQTYVGSNNINLLIPFGQFGTRLMGGEDSADQYNTHTMISAVTRLIFHSHDDPLLSANSSHDGSQKIEPKWYIPIIPMILVNGSEGTGTGWSTKIPKHDPRQLIRCLRNMIAGKVPEVLTPYYRNFRGKIEAVGCSRFLSIGRMAVIEDEQIEITELPIGTWTTIYKENVLDQLLNGTETTKPIITDYKEYHTDSTVRFVINFAPGEFDKLQKETVGFHRIFKLYGTIKTDNMHAYDRSNSLRRYEDANEILKEFYDLRLEYYAKRREYLERKLTAEAEKLSNQARFILAKIDKTLVVENKKRKTIINELTQLGYQPDPVEKWKQEIGIDPDDKTEREEWQHLPSNEKTDVMNYDYLLSMSMWMLTEEMKNQLIGRRDEKKCELDVLKAKSKYDLWLADLEELENKLHEVEEIERINLSYNRDNEDLHPSEGGKNIEFDVSDELFMQLVLMEQ